MKKIVITALHLGHGGVEKVIASMANLFIELDYRVEIICTYNLGQPAYNISDDVVITYLTSYVPNKKEFGTALSNRDFLETINQGFKSLRILAKKRSSMIKAIKKTENSIVISTRNETSIMLSKYGKKSVFKIAQLHHDHKFNKKIVRDFRTKYSKIDYFLLLNDTLTNEVIEFIKGYNNFTKCITLPNFLENEVINEIGPKSNYLISVGRLHSDKGYVRLINLWEKIHFSLPDHKLIIIGDGELRGSLEKLAESKGVSDSVVFKGMLNHDETLEYMRKSKMFLMTSISEALPMVLLESMSQGTVPIAFDVRVGPRSIIEDSKNGFLIEDGDFEQYYTTVIKYISEYSLNNEFELNALSKAEKYSKSNILQTWNKVLEEAE